MSSPDPHSDPPPEWFCLVPVTREDLANFGQARHFTDRMSVAIEQAQSEGHQRLALDFRQVNRLGSAGLNGLIELNSNARCDGLRVVLLNVQESVREVFSLTRLERLFDFAEGPAIGRSV